MHLYFAAMEHIAGKPSAEKAIGGMDLRHILITYTQFSKLSESRQNVFFAWAKQYGYVVAIDSGVFSMLKYSKEGNLSPAWMKDYFQQYTLFLKRYAGFYDWCVTLDLDNIPGYSAQWSDYYYKKMKDMGLPVKHVFHFLNNDGKLVANPVPQFERLRYLMDLTDGETCIGSSVFVGSVRKKFPNFMPHFFKVYPDNKVHWLGLGNLNMVLRYPIYSGDSSSWCQAGIFGNITFFNGLRCQTLHRKDVDKISRKFDSLRSHLVNFKKALNSKNETGISCWLERSKLAIQALIFFRDVVNSIRDHRFMKIIGEGKYDNEEEKVPAQAE